METKCTKNGNWISPCSALEEVTRENIGDIASQVRSRFSDGATKLVIVAGRFKKNKVQLNYCPFCGADVVTEFKETSHG